MRAYDAHKAETNKVTEKIHHPDSPVYQKCWEIQNSASFWHAREILAKALQAAYDEGEKDIQKFIFGD